MMRDVRRSPCRIRAVTPMAALLGNPAWAVPRLPRTPLTSIEGPIIQRDYAQGRSTASVIAIRDDFLEVLDGAVTGEGPWAWTSCTAALGQRPAAP